MPGRVGVFRRILRNQTGFSGESSIAAPPLFESIAVPFRNGYAPRDKYMSPEATCAGR